MSTENAGARKIAVPQDGEIAALGLDSLKVFRTLLYPFHNSTMAVNPNNTVDFMTPHGMLRMTIQSAPEEADLAMALVTGRFTPTLTVNPIRPSSKPGFGYMRLELTLEEVPLNTIVDTPPNDLSLPSGWNILDAGDFHDPIGETEVQGLLGNGLLPYLGLVYRAQAPGNLAKLKYSGYYLQPSSALMSRANLIGDEEDPFRVGQFMLRASNWHLQPAPFVAFLTAIPRIWEVDSATATKNEFYGHAPSTVDAANALSNLLRRNTLAHLIASTATSLAHAFHSLLQATTLDQVASLKLTIFQNVMKPVSDVDGANIQMALERWDNIDLECAKFGNQFKTAYRQFVAPREYLSELRDDYRLRLEELISNVRKYEGSDKLHLDNNIPSGCPLAITKPARLMLQNLSSMGFYAQEEIEKGIDYFGAPVSNARLP